METRRLLLFIVFSFSLIILWGEWNRQGQPASPQIQENKGVSQTPEVTSLKSVPAQPKESKIEAPTGANLVVETDNYVVNINTAGGNINGITLLKHRETDDKTKPIKLFQQDENHTYLAQSGLLGRGLPTHNATFETTLSGTARLESGKNDISIILTAADKDKVQVSKTYTFHRDSYLVDVVYQIENKSKEAIQPTAYFQLVRDDEPPEGGSKFIPTYTGPAIYTDEEKFKKIEFSDIAKEKQKLPTAANNGWVGMLQHYFVSAWLPEGNGQREFYTKSLGEGLFSAGVVMPEAEIAPGQTAEIKSRLYVGPAKTKLNDIVPGLGLSVDYGIFTIFASPLFWLMDFLNTWIGNWGVSIVLLTVLIKLAFFPLSAASYRSMAKMRLVAPKLEKIKQQCGDDRERLNRAMMDLYKSEKINPLGGCLPVLIQIPVFIGLYWAILESVELRHAEFVGWIVDLSATDPYFVLPIIMGVSMLIQSKLNPTPTDPLQAKIMQIMPVAFSVIFFFFPAGLVLYSIVNNILSISQQWYITHNAEAAQKGASKA
ncbi:MAG: membrane protein insertase YidC [Gammaproteobacteria bacterium]|nr:membrane protein insertase YidC [Gammaproteobacteria bacterium]MBU1624585.1 membrane protein insertase YidC [Gammaproteobacteria bacterium]MBU1982429.1 membrane protein insertase YidC [Gammaproteobacteria bacterium]